MNRYTTCKLYLFVFKKLDFPRFTFLDVNPGFYEVKELEDSYRMLDKPYVGVPKSWLKAYRGNLVLFKETDITKFVKVMYELA